MKFIVKEISSSRKEVRVALHPIEINGMKHYVFGQSSGTFSEGSIDNKYIPLDSSKYSSAGPNPGVIRLIVAFLKDTLGTPVGSTDAVIVTEDGTQIPVLNIAVDDITITRVCHYKKRYFNSKKNNNYTRTRSFLYIFRRSSCCISWISTR